jgi:uncharacterized repeat protein (TIGR01451 family)
MIAGLGAFTACLVFWAAFAVAQTEPGRMPSPEATPPAGAAPAGVEKMPEAPPPQPASGEMKTIEAASGSIPPPPPGAGSPSLPGGTPPPPAVEPMPSPSAPAPVQQPSVAPAPAAAVPTAPAPDAGLPAANSVSMPAAANKPFVPDERGGSEVSVSAENPSGRQEPSVSIEWVGAGVAKVGQATDFTLMVRNTCNIAVQQVIVRVRVPNGLSVQGTEPRAANEGGILVWDLGTMMSKQERAIQMKLQADVKGDVTPQAWVTFTGSTVMRIRVREPKLAMKATAPDKALVGDPAAFTLTVSNPGDGSADQVKIQAVLSEGLEHARGNKIDFDIGNLAAGESRNVTLLCATRVGGLQKCEAVAVAEGGLSAKDTASLNVIMPRLDLHVVGPRLRYLDRKAIYALKVTNPGDAPASNVTVADVVPAGFKVLAASDGGRHDYQTRAVSWFLGEIGPGQTREVKLEVQAISPGDHKHKASAVGARGLHAESELLTRVEGLSALMVEMVDTEDPIEVSGDTAYEVRITNTGSKTETDIKLVAMVPDKMQFKNAQGPVRYREEGRMVAFEPIEKLAPRADAIFRINVKALEAGTVLFKIQVTSTNLPEPVLKTEATRIYADSPEPSTSTTPGAPPAVPGGQ